MARKHLGTYALFGHHPISGVVNPRNRVGTGYVYNAEQYLKAKQRMESEGAPFRFRERNEECFRELLRQLDGLWKAATVPAPAALFSDTATDRALEEL